MTGKSIWTTGFLISFLLLWPLYEGKLWIIDDHEITLLASVLEKSGRHGVASSFKTALAETEVTHWGESSRYRPVYYFFRVLKSYLFGTNARAWFLWNCFFFFFSIVYLGLSIRYFFPPPFVVLGMLLFAALPCYADIWGRLGPNETDASLWTALFVYGMARYVKNYPASWEIMCFSAFMAMGSKENFTLLLLPLLIVMTHRIGKRNKVGSSIFFLLFPVGMFCTIWASIVFFISGLPRTVDMYGQSMSLLARARVVFNFFYEGPRACVVMTVFLLLYSFCCLARDRIRDVKNTFIAMLVLSICILGNFVFYNGETSLLMRYAYIEQLFTVMLFFVALFPLRQSLLDSWKENALFRRHLSRWCYVLGTLSIFSILALCRVNYFRVQRTLEFDDFLTRLPKYDNAQVINLGQPISSFEPYFSLKRFTEAGVIPKVYYFPVWAQPDSTFQEELNDALKQETAANPAPLLSPDVALVEFNGVNGWFRFIEHASPHREIEQTILMSGWREKSGRLEKFLGTVSASKGRSSEGGRMRLALPIEKIQAYKMIVNAIPFSAEDREVVFSVNDIEVKRAKLKDYREDFNFEVSEEVVRRFLLHKNLILLETRIENCDIDKPNGLTFYSIDLLPLS
jgi:hypothetical protein